MQAVSASRTTARFQPLSATMGADTSDIDVSHADAVPMDDVLAAFRQHHLLSFRGQTLTDEQIYNFAAKFGPVEQNKRRYADGTVMASVHGITNLDADGKPSSRPDVRENYYWHSDKSHQEVPALTTMLYGVEIPPAGGETEFADMTRAYAALPPETKRRIDDLKVEHSWGYMRETVAGLAPTEEEKLKSPPVIHPLVRIHPDTGAKSLYVGMYCSRVIGMDVSEGRELLKEMIDHATRPEFLFRYKWRQGDLVMWDNRCLVHRALDNFEMDKHRRILRRVVVRGTRP
uniref:Putative TauD/TfdA family dioxygenase n=1 Tax=uncultured bacterium 1114 TaxID=548901 RepID=B8R933_9BACT|nr:putative TauD/TfdA family dioxygenase [uncultured bacterium 1114]